MSNEKHLVHLTEAERKKLLAVISKGRNKALVIQRAHILLKVDEGKADAVIRDMLYVSEHLCLRPGAGKPSGGHGCASSRKAWKRPWKTGPTLRGTRSWTRNRKRT